jgi:hypothetical protein
MSAENVDKICSGCTLGEQIQGGMINFPIKTRITPSIMITPKIKRNCLNLLENIKGSLLGKVEKTIGYEIPIERDDQTVSFYAKCVKPDSYTPRE